MLIRDLKLQDLKDIESFHNGDFPLPDINSPLYFVQKVVEIDGETQGAVFVYLTSEISLILNKSLSRLTRAKVVKEVFVEMLRELPRTGLRDTHVFIVPENDEKYAQFLIKRFGFERAEGIPLYLKPGGLG
jgi:hypothetical protein